MTRLRIFIAEKNHCFSAHAADLVCIFAHWVVHADIEGEDFAYILLHPQIDIRNPRPANQQHIVCLQGGQLSLRQIAVQRVVETNNPVIVSAVTLKADDDECFRVRGSREPASTS